MPLNCEVGLFFMITLCDINQSHRMGNGQSVSWEQRLYAVAKATKQPAALSTRGTSGTHGNAKWLRNVGMATTHISASWITITITQT